MGRDASSRLERFWHCLVVLPEADTSTAQRIREQVPDSKPQIPDQAIRAKATTRFEGEQVATRSWTVVPMLRVHGRSGNAGQVEWKDDRPVSPFFWQVPGGSEAAKPCLSALLQVVLQVLFVVSGFGS